jgi:aspartyl-tRNA(Asn)/glutamyl-tRNA(Gln) amidotransferase subunit A
MNINLHTLTIEKARAHLDEGDFTAVQLTQAYLDTIAKRNPEINAYLEVFDDALDMAHEADKRIAEKNSMPLTGIPFAIKDNILIEGKRAGSASKILDGYTAPYDATVISKLKKQGAIFLGRVNMDEFAMGGSTENSAYGPTRNPYDTSRVPGGSSGGSAAAVAMDGALVALGSDTGGSVRQPASFCGIVGLKPTYGSVSRYGLMAMGSSLDQIGPLTKTVADARIVHEAIAGQDPMDGTTIAPDTFPAQALKKKYTVGVPRAFMSQGGIDKAVLANFEESIERLKKAGIEIRDISLPNVGYSLPVYYIIMPAEASTNLSRFDGMRFGARIEGETLLGDYCKTRGALFGKEVRRRIVLGTYVLSAGYYDAYYNKAVAVRSLIRSDFKKAFADGVDAVLTPTSPIPAFKIGEKSSDPLEMYLADIFTVTANIAGIPALSVPSGFTEVEGKKLPLGVQFMATDGGENTLFDIASIFERTS